MSRDSCERCLELRHPLPDGLLSRLLRASFKGRTSDFHSDDAGSIPVARSQSSSRNRSYFRPRKMLYRAVMAVVGMR
jgi:hypothetical protein